MPVNDDQINLSVRLHSEWTQQQIAALANAHLWLTQAARGEVPTGGTMLTHTPNPYANDPPMDIGKLMEGTDMMPLEDGNE